MAGFSLAEAALNLLENDMKTFAVDENNDFFVDKTGSFPIISGRDAVAQTSKHFAATKLEEMIHQHDLGIPFFETSFNRFPSIPQFEVALRKRLKEVPTVTSVPRVDVDYSNGVLSYTATIKTEQGEIPVNGRL